MQESIINRIIFGWLENIFGSLTFKKIGRGLLQRHQKAQKLTKSKNQKKKVWNKTVHKSSLKMGNFWAANDGDFYSPDICRNYWRGLKWSIIGTSKPEGVKIFDSFTNSELHFPQNNMLVWHFVK